MTAITPNKSFGVGFRHGQIMVRDADGYPLAASATIPYYGLFIETGKQLTVNDPDFRKITHVGADTVVQYDTLPPNEAASAELQVSGSDFDLDAALTGLVVHAMGESKRILINTDRKGYEKDVMFLAYQQSTVGGRRWRYFVMPSGVIAPRAIGFDDNPEVRTYPVTPHYVTYNEFGVPFTVLATGAQRAQFASGVSAGQPTWCAFLGNGTLTDFSFDTAMPAINNTCITVTIDGAVVSTGITYTTLKVTFTTAPATGKKVCIWYER
jgi:hypothetical protein